MLRSLPEILASTLTKTTQTEELATNARQRAIKQEKWEERALTKKEERDQVCAAYHLTKSVKKVEVRDMVSAQIIINSKNASHVLHQLDLFPYPEQVKPITQKSASSMEAAQGPWGEEIFKNTTNFASSTEPMLGPFVSL